MTRFHHLDTLRFFFAVAVVLGHSHTWAVVPKGGLAVDFFFILSGFVITHMVIAREPSFTKFTVSRIARMWPLHIVTMIATITVTAMTIPNWSPNFMGRFGEVVLHNTLMTHAIGPLENLTLNGPSWSISVEFWANILLLYFFARFRLVGVAAMIAAASYIILLVEGPKFDHAHMEAFGPTTLAFIRCAGGVAVGYLMYEYFLKASNPEIVASKAKWSAAHGGALLVIGYFFTQRGSDGLENALLMVALCALIMSMVLHPSHVVDALSNKYVAYTGNLSFGVYLIHWPLLMAGRANDLWLSSEIWTAFEFTAFWVILLALSVASYHLLEIPAKNLIMSPFRRKKAAAVPAE